MSNVRNDFTSIYNELIDSYQKVIGYEALAVYVNLRRYVYKVNLPSMNELSENMNIKLDILNNCLNKLERVNLIESVNFTDEFFTINDPVDNITYDEVYKMFLKNI